MIRINNGFCNHATLRQTHGRAQHTATAAACAGRAKRVTYHLVLGVGDLQSLRDHARVVGRHGSCRRGGDFLLQVPRQGDEQREVVQGRRVGVGELGVNDRHRRVGALGLGEGVHDAHTGLVVRNHVRIRGCLHKHKASTCK